MIKGLLGMRTGLATGLNSLEETEGDYMLKTRVLQASTGQTMTISGLSGNSDGAYIIKGRLVIPSATLQTLTMRPNGLTTNLFSRDTNNYGTLGGTSADWSLGSWSAGFTGSPLRVDLRMEIFPGKTQDGNTAYTTFFSELHLCAPTTGTLETYSFQSHGVWNETATELTSLVLNSSNASGLEAGSELLVYVPTVSFTA